MRTLAALALLVFAAEVPARELDDLSPLLKPILREHRVPALGCALLNRDGLVAIGAAGERKRGSGVAATMNDLWHIGSCTKAMTATLCGILVDKRKVTFGTTLGGAFPKARVHEELRGVTLAQLLTNRGGLPTSLDADGLWMRLWAHTGTPREARRLLAEGLLPKPPAVKPGTKYVYSNAGFSLAGAICEEAMKTPWEDLIRRQLFTPLGMKSASFGAPGDAKKMDQPWGHKEDGTPVPPGRWADNPVAIAPAGRVHCTLADWAKFVRLHLRGGLVGEKERLLQPQTIERLHASPAGQEYAAGWARPRREWAGGPVLTHNGSNTMWYAVVWAAPKKGFAVLVTCNQGGARAARACDAVASKLVARASR